MEESCKNILILFEIAVFLLLRLYSHPDLSKQNRVREIHLNKHKLQSL